MFVALLLPLVCDLASGAPNGYSCQSGQTKALHLPFCNATLSFRARVTDLLRRLTLQEKVCEGMPL